MCDPASNRTCFQFETMQAKIGDLKAAIDRQDNGIERRDTEIASLKADLSACKATLETRDEELSAADEAIEQWKTAYERERAQLLSKALDLGEANRKISAWMIAESEAKKKLAESKDLNAQLRAELESLRKASMADAVQSVTGKALADGRADKLEQTVVQLVEVLAWMIQND